jgi:glutaredoxin 3
VVEKNKKYPIYNGCTFMNTFQKPILYIKAGCPWCTEAIAYFKAHSVQLETREVRSNKVFMDQMVKLSGQTKTPTFVLGDFIVPDFDIGEFKAAINKAPAIKQQLGVS